MCRWKDAKGWTILFQINFIHELHDKDACMIMQFEMMELLRCLNFAFWFSASAQRQFSTSTKSVISKIMKNSCPSAITEIADPHRVSNHHRDSLAKSYFYVQYRMISFQSIFTQHRISFTLLALSLSRQILVDENKLNNSKLRWTTRRFGEMRVWDRDGWFVGRIDWT